MMVKKVLLASMLLGGATWAGFDFGECSGSGAFEQEIEQYGGDYENAVTVGTIPRGIKGLKISLESDKDVDIRLYGENDDKIVHWPKGILKQSSQNTKPYKDVTITYSGYNGIDQQRGHEFIEVHGSTPTEMTMKAFGYKAGYATVAYSWTGKDGCQASSDGGSGAFEQKILAKSTSLVGTIPPGIDDVYIKLTSDKDLDIQLFGDDGTAIVSWKPQGLVSGADKQSVSYEGMEIEWSGYEGDGKSKGNEYIKISGTTSQTLTMKVYGYEAGSANVEYSWGDKKNSIQSDESVVSSITDAGNVQATPITSTDAKQANLQFIKYTNGVDSKTSTSPTEVLAYGGPVQWRYTILNTGSEKLIDIAVTDDKEGIVGNCPVTLEVGAYGDCTIDGSTSYEASSSYTNTATVVARGEISGTQISVSDISNYNATYPEYMLTLKPYVNGHSLFSKEAPSLVDGGIAVMYMVTNYSYDTLFNVEVYSSENGYICTIDKIDVGPDNWEGCTITGDAKNIRNSDTMSVTIKDASGATVYSVSETAYYNKKVSDIKLTKTSNKSSASVGDEIEYTITAENNGTVILYGVELVDSDLGLQKHCYALTPHDTCTMVGTYTVTSSDANNGSITSSAHVDTNETDSMATATSTVTVGSSSTGIAMIKTGSLSSDKKKINYTFKVKNTGDSALHDVVITDSSINMPTITIGNLSSNQEVTKTYSYTITQSDKNAGKKTNQATVSAKDSSNHTISDLSDNNSYTQNDHTITTIPQHPAIAMIKTGTKSSDKKKINYTFRVKNTGDVSLTNISISDSVLNISNLSVGNLNPGQTKTINAPTPYTITTQDRDRGYKDNQATVTSKDPKNHTVTDLSDNNSYSQNDKTRVTVDPNPVTVSLAPLYNLTLYQDDGVNDVDLTITNTSNEPTKITATSSNTKVVTVSSTNPLRVTPVHGATGSATIRVTVSAAGKSDTKTFVVTVSKQESSNNDYGWLPAINHIILF